MTDMLKDDLIAAGLSRIAWAGRSMPNVSAAIKRLADGGGVKGKRIGVSLVLEPKTANLVLGLRDAGATMSVYAPADSTDAATIAALRSEGVTVFSDPAASADQDLDMARDFLRTEPQILVDDGASVIRLAHREFPDLVDGMIGAAEETTSGVRPLRMMVADGALRLPVIAVNDSPLKYLFDNVYGTGQSCVMALLDVTNLQIAGRKVLVIGYGWVGKGVARHAAALGARVTVAELDPIKALQALHDGHDVASIKDAAADCEVVFASTGIAGVLTPAHLNAMPDGVILCTAGGGNFELPMAYLRTEGEPATIRTHVEAYALKTGKSVLVIAGGHCINCAAGEGNPIEIMDLSLALQAAAIETLVRDGPNWPAGVYPIDSGIEAQIATERLAAKGASIEPMTPALEAAMQEW